MPFDIIGTTASIGSTLARGVRTGATAAAGGSGAEAFSDSLSRLVSTVEESQADANQAITNMVEKNGDVHDAMIALQRAEMTLQLTVQVRNKLVQAYQDVMRMPI